MERAVGRAGRNALRTGHEVRVELEEPCRAAPEIVYDLLSDLRSHLEWGGERQPKQNFRLLTLDAPEGSASVGTEWTSTGADPGGKWEDRSVVTQAEHPHVFEFVTDGRIALGNGGSSEWTLVHRYELRPAAPGCTIVKMTRVTRMSELPGMMRFFRSRIARPLLQKMAAGYERRGVRNLARMAEERAGTFAS